MIANGSPLGTPTGGTSATGGGGPTAGRRVRGRFSDDLLPTFEVLIAQADWDALVSDFYSMAQNEALGLDIHPYHPLTEFKYGGEVVPNAMIRLKGQSSWREAVEAGDNPPKLQFVISFTEVDPTTRFHGLRKLELDMPRTDPSYLRQRLTLDLPARAGSAGPVREQRAPGRRTALLRPVHEPRTPRQGVHPARCSRAMTPAICGTAAGAWRRTRRRRRSPIRGSTRGGRSTTSRR